ncbi:MAG: PEP-CTERM sorting domain-containing protein [Cyanobacteria bacterium J06638_20]
MQFNLLPTLLGTATIALTSTIFTSTEVQAANFVVDSGVTSVFLDVDTLSTVGLDLTGTVGEVQPPVSDDFLVGFTITPETDFSFSDEGGFTLLGGSIEHTGGVEFNGGTDGELAVGDFSIGFDATRVDETTGATGFFVQDLLTTSAVLFDIAGVAPSFDGENLTIDGELLVSEELSGVLGNPALIGAAVGSAQINAATSETAASIPEPASIAGLLLVGSAGIVARRKLA